MVNLREEILELTIYRCGECGIESHDKDTVVSCVRRHTKLRLDKLEQDIRHLRVLIVCVLLANEIHWIQERIERLGPSWR